MSADFVDYDDDQDDNDTNMVESSITYAKDKHTLHRKKNNNNNSNNNSNDFDSHSNHNNNNKNKSEHHNDDNESKVEKIGRGHDSKMQNSNKYKNDGVKSGGIFESYEDTNMKDHNNNNHNNNNDYHHSSHSHNHNNNVDSSNVQKSVEGYVLMVQGIHEEAKDDDIIEAFGDYGNVKQIHLNLDRRTGWVKGYALIEFATYKEAQTAIDKLNDSEILGQTITVGWAFKKSN